ncbi:hypothetical protein J2S25_003777 [Mesobacillus stamsii]|uniref:Uncharacterized protein n=1 Tax=Mesobacillus stamsii TaxID=225347 RepID=A0ABU0G036_9BACI|nr:hypothetical protein [Mesobacillus stamsii]
MRHAASVRPEPGSNSPKKSMSLAHKLKRWLMSFYNRSHDNLLFVDACLFSFQRTNCVRRSEATFLIYHALDLMSITFLTRHLSNYLNGSAATFINISGYTRFVNNYFLKNFIPLICFFCRHIFQAFLWRCNSFK